MEILLSFFIHFTIDKLSRFHLDFNFLIGKFRVT